MPTHLLLSYHPLASTPNGRKIAARFGRDLFEDGSPRTEPNLKHEIPSVSSLCRGKRVVTSVEQGSMLVYVTVKRRYFGSVESVQFLTAILEVARVLEDHKQALNHYAEEGLEVPRNVVLVPQLPANESTFPYDRILRRYVTPIESEETYQKRGALYGKYILCRAKYLNLTDPPKVYLRDPYATQYGKEIDREEVNEFLRTATANQDQ